MLFCDKNGLLFGVAVTSGPINKLNKIITIKRLPQNTQMRIDPSRYTPENCYIIDNITRSMMLKIIH